MSFILCKARVSTRSPSRLTIPAIPHISAYSNGLPELRTSGQQRHSTGHQLRGAYGSAAVGRRRSRFLQDRPVDGDDLLRQDPLAEFLDSTPAVDALPLAEDALEASGNRFRPFVSTQFTPLDPLQPLRNIAHANGNHRQVASQGFLDDVRGAFLAGSEDEGIASVHENWDGAMGHLPAQDDPSG